MTNRVICAVLLMFLATFAVGEIPSIPIEQAIASAKAHVQSQKIDTSKHYLASVEWHPRSGLMSFWRIEWRMKEPVKGGQIIVTVDAAGKVEHGFGE